jgi:hypothetical protein
VRLGEKACIEAGNMARHFTAYSPEQRCTAKRHRGLGGDGNGIGSSP